MLTQTIQTLLPAGQTFKADRRVLRRHPRNMRRAYPLADVKIMVGSIKENRGVFQPLLVIENPQEAGIYYVVDGNMRLAAADFLGDECPLLEVKIIAASEADQLLTMAVVNNVRFDIPPISEALHFQSLRREGKTNQEIAKALGRSTNHVADRLELLNLDEPIQDLIERGDLPTHKDLARALLGIEDATKRLELATRVKGLNVASIIEACKALPSKPTRPRLGRPPKNTNPMRHLAEDDMAASGSARVQWKDTREAAKAMCESCALRVGELARLEEPAWRLIGQAADETCQQCGLGDDLANCRECPGVELLRRMAQKARAQ